MISRHTLHPQLVYSTYISTPPTAESSSIVFERDEEAETFKAKLMDATAYKQLRLAMPELVPLLRGAEGNHRHRVHNQGTIIDPLTLLIAGPPCATLDKRSSEPNHWLYSDPPVVLSGTRDSVTPGEGVCYVTNAAYVAEARREWERRTNNAITDYVVVPALPRGALLEWQTTQVAGYQKVVDSSVINLPVFDAF
ncbi:diphthine--ammonia ligase [Homalodisca vitripennis]|nr:diphthine--ammonia ligase [Homalodisca vitripennis]